MLQRAGALHHRAPFGRYLAEHISDAKYVELPGADTLPFSAGDFEPLLDEVEEFLTGTRAAPVLNRQLATVMFTDIVGSTVLVSERGDAAWVALVREYDEIVRDHLDTYRGREIDHTGDGFLATFDGPARAVTCAVAAGGGAGDTWDQAFARGCTRARSRSSAERSEGSRCTLPRV